MIVLGIDTSGYANTVGVVENGRVLVDVAREGRTDSLQRIVADIDDALKTAGKSLEDVDGIGVGLGPGSWTGIRVGVTVAKMLAFSLEKPIAGVSTLDALAQEAGGSSREVCSIIDVGTRRTVYAAFFQFENGHAKRTGEYFVGGIRELAAMIDGEITIISAEADKYAAAIQEEGAQVAITAVTAAPRGATIARLAEYRLSKGESDDVLSLTPLYLKESTAWAFVSKYRGGQV